MVAKKEKDKLNKYRRAAAVSAASLEIINCTSMPFQQRFNARNTELGVYDNTKLLRKSISSFEISCAFIFYSQTK